MEDKRQKTFLSWMLNKRRLVETVIGQLTERFHIERSELEIYGISLVDFGGKY